METYNRVFPRPGRDHFELMEYESLKSLVLGLTVIHISNIPPWKKRGKELFIPGRQPYRHLNYQLASQMGNYYLNTYYMLGTELGHNGYNGEHTFPPLWNL